ncbi:MAG: hypothetical protein VX096_03360 [Pseudomonadota bacterium]|nr:hypothetical protein [Pseudomonadota bacterium]
MKFLTFFFLTFLLVSCGNIKSPSIISPDLNLKMVSDGDYGSIPLTYTKILKKYLIKEFNDHKETKIEFVNEPQRLSIEHLGDIYSGFRVCLSINEKKDGYYRGWRNHFFMINNDEVTLHLYDSGLLTIPFEYCITRDVSKTMLVQNIPEKIESEQLEIKKIDKAKSINDMDESKPSLAYVDPDYDSYSRGNKFILCNLNNDEITFVFNESNSTFYQFGFDSKQSFEPMFTEVLIAAKSQNANIEINRVSGLIQITTENSKSNGKCDILDKTRF